MLSTSLLDCLFSLFLVNKFYNRPVKKSTRKAKTKEDLSDVRPIENLANRGPTWDQAAAAETKQKQKSEKFGENSQQEIFFLRQHLDEFQKKLNATELQSC